MKNKTLISLLLVGFLSGCNFGSADSSSSSSFESSTKVEESTNKSTNSSTQDKTSSSSSSSSDKTSSSTNKDSSSSFLPDVEFEPAVFYYNTNNWSEVYCYVWDGLGTELNGAWPGDKMSQVEGKSNWYYAAFDTQNPYSIVFSNGEGSQTDDIVGSTENNYYFGDSTVGYGSFEATEEAANNVVTEEITLYFKNTQNWSQVNCYAWRDSNSNATWPGAAMTLVEGAYYSYTLDAAKYDSIIFNNGTAQTVDLSLADVEDNTMFTLDSQNGEGKWTCKTSIYGEEPTDPETPVDPDTPVDPVNGTTVYYYNSLGWSTVNCYAWDGAGATLNGTWPGSAMEVVEGRENWYQVTFNTTDLFNVIFNNGSTQSPKDIAVTDDNVYFYGLATVGCASFEAAEDAAAIPSETEITIYFKNTQKWSQVYCYAWTSASNASWPGEKMTQVEGEYYSYKLDTSLYSNVIFNNGSGTQTVDISLSGVEDNTLFTLNSNSSGKWTCTTNIYGE